MSFLLEKILKAIADFQNQGLAVTPQLLDFENQFKMMIYHHFDFQNPLTSSGDVYTYSIVCIYSI